MKNTFKRIAVIALAVVMCVSAVVPAFAAGNACPGEGKTHTAYNCTYQEVSKQEATCELAGSVTGKCATCGVIFSVSTTEKLGHDWTTTTQATCDTAAIKVCKRCDEEVEVSAALDCLYTAWTLAEGECGVKGARVTRECIYCGDVEADKLGSGTEAMGKENHVYSLVSYVAPAKCIDKGLATYECVVAGCDAVKEVAIAATENVAKHDFKAWDDAAVEDIVDGKKDPNKVTATCDAKGRASMICADCETIVVVATDKKVCDVDHVEAKPNSCITAGNIEYWHCPDCDAYYSNVALTKKITKAKTVVAAIHDGLAKSAEAIDYEALPTCDTDGLVTYSCKVCNVKVGEVTLDKYKNHLYYNDVKDVATKKTIITALQNVAKLAAEATEDTSDDNYYLKGESISGWSNAKIESEWAKLGEVKVGGVGEGKVWKGYTPATCDKNATVTYLCLNCTKSNEYSKYVFVTCDVATETTLTGKGYEKIGHAFADTYPLSHSDSSKAGKQAYAWDGLEASCKTVGRRINYCINEYQLPNGTYTSCTKTETVGVAALGHDYVALTLADLDKDDDETKYTVKTEEKTEAELYEIVKADVVTCVDDGMAYTVCTRCNDVQSTKATSAGTEHDWKYLNALGVEYTPDDIAAKVNCVTALTDVYRQCKTEGCKAANAMEATTIPATGHKYVDTTDAKVVEELLKLAEGASDANGNKYVKKATCENGATFTLDCLNDGCSFPKTFEYSEGFGGGHVKTYIPNTAIAATCTKTGSSNKWFCSNEGCEYYGYYDNDNKLVDADKNEIDYDDLKADVETATTHKIWNAKKEVYEAVTYKHVPDANVSGVDEDDAKKVEAPVVDGKVVRYVAIEGTSLVWVYKYESKDHKVASVDEGFLFCVDCNEIGGDYDVFEGEDCNASGDASIPASCESVGYTYKYCTKCFEGAITGFTPALEHEYYFTADGAINETVWKSTYKGSDTAKKEGLNYVAPTCTSAGYAIDNCKTCDKVVTIAVAATGHINDDGEVLDSSCLNVAFPRDCDVCGVKNVPYGHDWNENAMCNVCGAAK